MTAPASELPDDAGMSLIELIITAMVAAVVLGLVATILTTTLQATAATRDRDLATGRAQALSTSLTGSIRSASAATVESVSGGGSILRARVAKTTSTWECRAWAVVDLETIDATGHRAGADGRYELRSLTYAPLGAAASVPAPTTTWTTLTEHVERTATATPYFAWDADSSRLTWNLAIVASEQPTLNDRSVAPVSGSAVALVRAGGTVPRCW